MSTYSHSRTRGRQPYDPSPSPTLVPSRSSSESTISLPRNSTGGGPLPPYEAGSPEHAHKVHGSIAKITIIFGVFTVIAGVMQYRKSKRAMKKAKLQEEQEASTRREDRRRRDNRDRAWNDYGQSHRTDRVTHTSEPLRIEGSVPPRSSRGGGGGSRYGGSDAGRSRR